MPFSVIIILAAEAVFGLWLLNHAGYIRKPAGFFVSVVLLAAAFVLRGCLFDYETLDYQNFLTKWVDFYRSNGGFSGLSRSVGNYNIPYLYFLALFSYSRIRDLYLIKLLSCFFDVLLAYGAMKLTAYLTESNTKRLAAFFAVLFLPTVVLNGALWGQCDSIYVALALLAVVYALDDRPVLSMVFWALSFGFKLQCVFLLPICALLWLRGKYDLWHFLLFPLSYVVLVLPAVIIGRPFRDAIMLYLDQAGSVGNGLNYNSPSVYAFFRNPADPALASNLGIITAFVLLFALIAVCMLYRDRLNDRVIISALLLMSIMIPYFLPHMHDRYFFAADVLSVAAAAAFPEMYIAAVSVQFASLLGYHAYLKMRYLLLMDRGASALILALALAVFMLAKSFFKKSEKI